MSDLVSQIMASSKVISAPIGEATAVDISPTTTEETHTPIVADALGLGVFFGENANEVCPPEVLSDIKSKVDSILDYARNNIKTYSDDSVNSFINKIVSENEWNKLKPIDKLERFYGYVDLQNRMSEMKSLNNTIKQLRESVNA